jgi:hypothetical protein
VTDICPQPADGSFIATDLDTVLADLPSAGATSAVKGQPVAVLLQLPLIPLQFALISAEIAYTSGLSRQQRREAQEHCYCQKQACSHCAPNAEYLQVLTQVRRKVAHILIPAPRNFGM